MTAPTAKRQKFRRSRSATIGSGSTHVHASADILAIAIGPMGPAGPQGRLPAAVDRAGGVLVRDDGDDDRAARQRGQGRGQRAQVVALDLQRAGEAGREITELGIGEFPNGIGHRTVIDEGDLV